MSYSLYQSCVPVFNHALNAFLAILDKARGPCGGDEVRSGGLYDAAAQARHVRLSAPGADVLRPRQERAVAPRRRRAAAFEDNETTLDELRARIRHTLDVIAAIDAKAVDAGAEREVIFPLGRGTKGEDARRRPTSLISRCRTSSSISSPLTTSCATPARRSASATISARFPASRSSDSSLRGTHSMSIRRIGVGPRMSQAVVHGDTVYLAGQVAAQGGGQERRRTDARNSRHDRQAARRSGHRQDAAAVGDDLSRRHRDLRRDERGVGAWVAPGATPARATVEAKLAAPSYTVEIVCVAAKS